MGLNKSRPIYQKLRIDPLGGAHLIVTDLNEVPEGMFETDLALSNIETWVVETSGPGIAAEACGNTRAFRAVADLHSHLSYRLVRELVGFRLYAAGTESIFVGCDELGASGRAGERRGFSEPSGQPAPAGVLYALQDHD